MFYSGFGTFVQVYLIIFMNIIKWYCLVLYVNLYATMVHKSLNRTAPDYMKEMFKFVTDGSQRQTRFVDNSKLYMPTGNYLNVFTDSFQYAAGAVWNKLPVHVREA